MISVVIAMFRGDAFIHSMRAHVLVPRVQPLHPLEHAGGARLHRQMHVVAPAPGSRRSHPRCPCRNRAGATW